MEAGCNQKVVPASRVSRKIVTFGKRNPVVVTIKVEVFARSRPIEQAWHQILAGAIHGTASPAVSRQLGQTQKDTGFRTR
jgi:squalene cyclase